MEDKARTLNNIYNNVNNSHNYMANGIIEMTKRIKATEARINQTMKEKGLTEEDIKQRMREGKERRARAKQEAQKQSAPVIEEAPKTIKLKSLSKKQLKQIDEVNEYLKKNMVTKGKRFNFPLTPIKARSIEFNKILDEAEKQLIKKQMSKRTFATVVILLQDGDFTTARNLTYHTQTLKDIDKMLKDFEKLKPIAQKKARATKTKQPMEQITITDEYLHSLPKNKNGTVNKVNKQYKALSADDKERVIKLTAVIKIPKAKKEPKPKKEAKPKKAIKPEPIKSEETYEEVKARINKLKEEKKKASAQNTEQSTLSKYKSALAKYAYLIKGAEELYKQPKRTPAEEVELKEKAKEAVRLFNDLKQIHFQLIKEGNSRSDLGLLLDAYDFAANVKFAQQRLPK